MLLDPKKKDQDERTLSSLLALPHFQQPHKPCAA